MKTFVLALLVPLVLAGCATSATAPSFSQAPVPKPREDAAVLYVIRENAVPYLFTGYLDIDGSRAIELQQQGFTWIYVKPGARKLKHHWPGLAGMPAVDFERNFAAGQTYVLEMKGRVTNRRDPLHPFSISTEVHPVAVAEAQQRMTACCRFTPPASSATEF